jgi:carbonic anhydrase/acetyltransferase-like protein (isoleucine patch superfamily)
VERIRIGRRTNLQDLTVVHVTGGRWSATIGDGVTAGHRAVLHGCTIHNDCLVGIGAVVLDGAEVGPESIVGAGALVPPGMRVPPRTLVTGVPARVTRELNGSEVDSIRDSAANYVSLRLDYDPSLG